MPTRIETDSPRPFRFPRKPTGAGADQRAVENFPITLAASASLHTRAGALNKALRAGQPQRWACSTKIANHHSSRREVAPRQARHQFPRGHFQTARGPRLTMNINEISSRNRALKNPRRRARQQKPSPQRSRQQNPIIERHHSSRGSTCPPPRSILSNTTGFPSLCPISTALRAQSRGSTTSQDRPHAFVTPWPRDWSKESRRLRPRT